MAQAELKDKNVVYYASTFFDYDKDAINQFMADQDVKFAVDNGLSTSSSGWKWKGLYFGAGALYNSYGSASADRAKSRTGSCETGEATYNLVTTTVRCSNLVSTDDTKTKTDYYYPVDGVYYPVYIIRTSRVEDGWLWDTTYYKYTLYANDEEIWSSTEASNTNATVPARTLYNKDVERISVTSSNYEDWVKWGQNDEADYGGYIHSGMTTGLVGGVPQFDDSYAERLFDSSEIDGKHRYVNVGLPFIYEGGYYSFDSSFNGAYFPNGMGENDVNLSLLDAPIVQNGFKNARDKVWYTSFMPFNNPVSDNTENTNIYQTDGTELTNTPAYRLEQISSGYNAPASYNHFFSMITPIPFTMTENGRINPSDDGSLPIVFEFSGDDDVWVFINDVLVLDLGGVHDAVSGEINFATNKITFETAASGMRDGDATSGGYGENNTTSNNSTYCSKISTSGATALSVRVNVTYTAGSIYAIAYDANGNVIENTVGNSRVNTPGAAAKLDAYADKAEIAADGCSLSYITLDVTDSDGNLDTAAANRIQLSLTGEGEIVGVDNGDPATLRKYQQSTVLTSASTANIDAYAGKALVIVRSTKTGGSFTLTASASGLTGDSVTVTTTSTGEEDEEIVIPVQTVTLNANALELKTGETFALTAEVAPDNAADKTVTWSTSAPEIVTVAGGVATAVAPGTAVVSATAGNVTAECVVTVVEPIVEVTGIRLNKTSLTLDAGAAATLTATVLPANATDPRVTWSSSDPAVVTVVNGKVTALAPGSAAVTAAAGGYSAVCTVTVNALPEEPQKAAPTVTVQVTYQNSMTTITGQSDIFVNPELYYTEVKHGILYIKSSMLGSRNLLVSTSGATNKVLTGFEEDGTFSHTFKPLSGSMAYTYRAYVYYEKPDGSQIYVYSPMVRGSGRSFQVD